MGQTTLWICPNNYGSLPTEHESGMHHDKRCEEIMQLKKGFFLLLRGLFLEVLYFNP